ncbi:galactofuranosylgalactofuranosylrhamnosyl-N-acetylglucosaminyl-diphospho-decaprenol beta-1,5/1,6-galactofuranosyltransferase [Amycolatopsis arida]|uniref:Galactofuranosylgalactofuranosylrhamnosyl-N-acetylglucosaminyl-diphospho-decaprenol beta-1,5/1,6-galactofuranosyltransferase n=1 Tax=Amycolatopsis arida TaxID=587909 RepID=A0A1I5YJA3_9PSEU|nr:glycosyltransferase [Amycolatopsis arida]TDX90556.1 galactofuranosylgalactofuranosylrhamnosyl-N-acetylglucosaminyl-diphospho-decaprenol beta-1,5/1,6-galactofuranosyltransferase [Amycolatopsis arida]SFQ44268.1 galactofuranosylgalactofuranosylrhamnosyl-N-acetylglucosaminyl-diphospho-decaprenol beta-1,5/1,6-galactofuranosyltransferase [Amycolatopsis arida]
MPGKAAPATASKPADNGTAPDAAEHVALTERAPQGRLLAQRGLYAGPSDLVSKDLYAQVVTGVALRRRSGVTLEPAATVSGNTYFGRFPASYWQRWTTAGQVRVEATVTGSGLLTVGASDAEGESRIVAAQSVQGVRGATVTLDAKLDKFLDGGALWLDLSTEAEQLTVENVRWTVEPPERIRPTAVTICTMNRADDCLGNLRALAGDLSSLETLDAIYVADQGTDTVESREGFAEVAAQLGEKLHYIRQPNLGGAGGFTRGLYEVAGSTETEHANVLFMDDDVLLEPDLVIRLTAFSNRAANPLIVGGQMLNLLHPNQLHVGAEYARLNTLEPGQPVEHSLSTADLLGVDEETGKPNRQERRLDAGYNGWWSCLIPYEVVKEVGYPLPYFFQWDDAEYSYRARAHGFPTVTLPGAGVWHADFHWKDWDEWHRYFNLRNSIITAALHSPFNVNLLTRVLVAQLVRYLLGMQYGLSATLIKAVEDFLEGPEILRDGGVAAMQEIRRLRDQYPETKRHPATDVPGIASSDIGIINTAPRPSLQRVVLLKRVLDRLFGRHRFGLGAIPSDEAHWWHVSLFETAVVTDASQEGVRVRRYDRQRMFDLARQGAKVLQRLRREGPAVRERYRRALPELSSRENWTRLYGL